MIGFIRVLVALLILAAAGFLGYALDTAGFPPSVAVIGASVPAGILLAWAWRVIRL